MRSVLVLVFALAACRGTSGDDTDVEDTGPSLADVYGGCVSETLYDDGASYPRMVTTYDDRGLDVLEQHYDADDVERMEIASTWRDDGGRLTKDRDSDPFGSVDDHQVWTWDGACNTVWTESDGASVFLTDTNTCDDDGHVVEADETDADGQLRKVTWSKWTDGDLVELDYDYGGDRVVDDVYVMTYDDDHHRLSWGEDVDGDGVADVGVSTYTWDGDEMVRVDSSTGRWTIYTYDEAGRETSETGYQENGDVEWSQATTWTCP